MKYVLATLLFITLWLTPSCAMDPILQAVHAKYPACDVLKVDREGQVVKVTIQCPGNRIKTVTMYDKS